MDLAGKVAAVLGGDGREVEIVRQLRASGAAVRTCGLPPEVAEVDGVVLCTSVAEAVTGAHIIICPIPLPYADGAIFAPATEQRLIVDKESLRPAAPNAVLITGKAGPQMRDAAAALNLKLHEYEHDEELMLLRAPAIAEGAIKVAIEHTEETLHGNPTMVVGFGKIGPTMARTLLGMGSRVTVAARNPIQLARAWEMGCTPVQVAELERYTRGMVAIFNTAPAPLITRSVLEGLDRGTVVIDLSAPPGGVDWDAARELNVRAVWARGLGGRAPRTVGRSQWKGIRRILQQELGVRV